MGHEKFMAMGFESVHFMAEQDVRGIDWSAFPGIYRTADLGRHTTEEALFDAVGEALEFPEWWGRNWDALDDCVTDLEWLGPTAGYVLSIPGRRLWAKAPGVAGLLTQVWLGAAGSWANPQPWDGEARSLHLIWTL